MDFLLKITQNQPDLLTLQHRPIGTVLFSLLWLVGFNVLGFIILRGGEPSGVYLNAVGILIPCIISLNMTRRVIITFDRPSNTFSTRHDYLLSKQEKHYKLDRVLRARLEVTNFGRHHAETYRCELEMTGGPAVLVSVDLATTKTVPQDLIDAINAWLQDDA